MKPLILGKAEVSFHHEYKKELIWSEKSDDAKEMAVPIATTATIVVSGVSVTSTAKCNPKDHFTFEKGRKLSLARAIQSHTGLMKADRKRVWEDYNKLKPGGRW